MGSDAATPVRTASGTIEHLVEVGVDLSPQEAATAVTNPLHSQRVSQQPVPLIKPCMGHWSVSDSPLSQGSLEAVQAKPGCCLVHGCANIDGRCTAPTPAPRTPCFRACADSSHTHEPYGLASGPGHRLTLTRSWVQSIPRPREVTERDLRAVARFLRLSPGLGRKVIGDLLGENCERCKRLLLVYASTFEFQGGRMVDAPPQIAPAAS